MGSGTRGCRRAGFLDRLLGVGARLSLPAFFRTIDDISPADRDETIYLSRQT